MKKEIFKVCALGLVAVTLVTGCGKNEKEVSEFISTSNIVAFQDSYKPVVEKIDVESYKRESNYEVMIEAKDSNEEIVWSKSAGKIGFNSDNYSVIAEEGDKYVYMNDYIDKESYFVALDKQTGEMVWKVKTEYGVVTCPTVIENDDKVYVVHGIGGSYALEIFDINNGKELKAISGLTGYVKNKNSKYDFEDYYDIHTDSMKISGNDIVFEVHEDEEEKFIGFLKIDKDNYNIKFEK